MRRIGRREAPEANRAQLCHRIAAKVRSVDDVGRWWVRRAECIELDVVPRDAGQAVPPRVGDIEIVVSEELELLRELAIGVIYERRSVVWSRDRDAGPVIAVVRGVTVCREELEAIDRMSSSVCTSQTNAA